MTDAVRIRAAEQADVPLIRALVDAAYAPWGAVLDPKPLPLLTDYRVAVDTHDIALLAVGSELRGLIEMARDGTDLLIVNLAVAPAWQCRGYGRTLLAHAEALGRRAELRRLRLYTNARMRENIVFYRSRGFAIDRQTQTDGRALVHMSKSFEGELP